MTPLQSLILQQHQATLQQSYRAPDLSNYRRREQEQSDDSESEEECADDEDYYDNEDRSSPRTAQALLLHRRRVILTDPAPSYVPPPSNTSHDPESATTYNSDDDDDWFHSNTKKRIIANLIDDNSDIHLHINEDLKKANYKQIYSMYVNKVKFSYKHFQPNFKRLLDSYREKKGPFDPSALGSSPTKWYTSVNEMSDGYILLKSLWRDRKDEMSSMLVQEIWNSHPVFQQYPLEKFKDYNYK